jgi:hypothetical protein
MEGLPKKREKGEKCLGYSLPQAPIFFTGIQASPSLGTKCPQDRKWVKGGTGGNGGAIGQSIKFRCHVEDGGAMATLHCKGYSTK